MLNIVDWVKVLQYADKYKPTPNAAGDLSQPSIVSGFAKLSDAAINAIPADKNGYFYYKFHDAGDRGYAITMLARTRHSFEDTAWGFGWWGEYDLCNGKQISKCEWKPARNGVPQNEGHRGIRFDTFGTYPNNCDRWFTDHLYKHNKQESCFEVHNSSRCFAKGLGCEGQIRDHVTMYKWQPHTDYILKSRYILV